jgi:hypothetical protein
MNTCGDPGCASFIWNGLQYPPESQLDARLE